MSRRHLILICFIALLISGCQGDNPSSKLPGEALRAAYAYWPVSKYPKLKTGPTSQQLPFAASAGIFDRWCIEVVYQDPGSPTVYKHAAVVIEQVISDPKYLDAWRARDPIMNSTCDGIK